VLDVVSGKELTSITVPRKEKAHQAYLTPDAKTLITANFEKAAVHLWDLSSGQLRQSLSTPFPWLHAMAYSPDGRHLALGTNLQPAINIRRLGPVREFDALPGPTPRGEAWSVAFSPDGKVLAAGYDNEAGQNQETLKLWDVATGKLLSILPGHSSTVMALAFAPAGKVLATASYDKTVKLWNVARPTNPLTLTGHAAPVRMLVFHPRGHLLATAGDDRTIKLWEVATGKLQRSWPAHDVKITALALSADGNLLASGAGDGSVRLWDTKTGALRHEVRMRTGVKSLQFHPGRRWLLVGRYDDLIEICETATGKLVQTLTSPQREIRALVCSPDGKSLATGDVKGTVMLRHAATGEELMPLKSTGAQINALAFSPDSKILAGASHDGRVLLWRAAALTDEQAPFVVPKR
jgi:WD40 repeat protein